MYIWNVLHSLKKDSFEKHDYNSLNAQIYSQTFLFYLIKCQWYKNLEILMAFIFNSIQLYSFQLCLNNIAPTKVSHL